MNEKPIPAGIAKIMQAKKNQWYLKRRKCNFKGAYSTIAEALEKKVTLTVTAHL